jgi:hypothetical protein
MLSVVFPSSNKPKAAYTKSNVSLLRESVEYNQFANVGNRLPEQIAIDKKINSLQKKLDEAEDKSYEANIEKIDALQERELAWQFIPDLDPHTPINELRRSHEIKTLKQFSAFQKTQEFEDEEHYWVPVSAESGPFEPAEKLELYISFLEMVESIPTYKLKAQAIDEFCVRNPDFKELHFKSSFSPGEKWVIDTLSSVGGWEKAVVEANLTSLDALTKLSVKELKAIKGIGPKKVADICEVLAAWK